MSWAMELSPSGFDAMLADLSYMDRKTGRAYLQLLGYLRRFGSVPSGERALASVLSVTVRYLREVAWPLLEDRLVLSDDKRRYSDPDIAAANPRRAAGAPAAQEKSAQHQKAALTRHARAREEAEAQARAHAERMKSDAKTHAEFMRGASETHAEFMRGASPDASDASPRAHELSLSKQALFYQSSSQPIDKERLLERESSRASAEDAGMGDAGPHARTHKNHARTHAQPHAVSTRPILPSVRPITTNWKPEPETLAEGLTIRADVEAQVRKFIRLNVGKGNTAADWNPLFLRFLEHANDYERRNPQASIPLVITGGGADPGNTKPEPEDDLITGTGVEAQWARVKRRLGKGISRNWLSKAEIGEIEDGELTITLPTRFIRDHVAKDYSTRLTTLWAEQNPEIRRLNLVEAAATEQRQAAD